MASRIDKLKVRPQENLRDKLSKVPVESVGLAPSSPISAEMPSIQQTKQRQEIQTFANQAGKAESPYDFDIKTALKKSIIADVQSPEINKAKTDIEEEYKKAFEEYKQDKDSAKWGQVAETLGQALTQLGAGAYGLKHGVDMSGVKFNKADWKSNIDSAMTDLQIARQKRNEQLEGRDQKEGQVLSRLDKLRQLQQLETPVQQSEMENAKLRTENLKAKKLEAEIANLGKKVEASKEPTTIEQKELAKAQGKAVGEWVSTGRGKTAKKIRGAEKALDLLKDEKTNMTLVGITGRTGSNITGKVLDFLGADDKSKGAQQAAEAQRLLEELQQSNIGEVLDAQFAAREADQVLQRGFDPLASKQSQIETVNYLLKTLRDTQIERDSLEDHIKAGNTSDTFVSPLRTEYEEKVLGKTKGKKAVESPQDSAARKWLEANPNHPKAEAVRLKLEGK